MMSSMIRLGKDLVAASAGPLVLSILAEGESYGYAIIQRVRELSAGQMQWTDGMLYPVLHRLEAQGQITAKWKTAENGRRRKYYAIRRQGRATLEDHKAQWKLVNGALSAMWSKEPITRIIHRGDAEDAEDSEVERGSFEFGERVVACVARGLDLFVFPCDVCASAVNYEIPGLKEPYWRRQ